MVRPGHQQEFFALCLVLATSPWQVVPAARAFQDCDQSFLTASGLAVPQGGACEISPGLHSYSTVEINGTVFTKADSITTDWLIVGPTGRLLSEGQGYAQESGSGGGSSEGSGGGHGGRGGNAGGRYLTSSQSMAHGSFHTPRTVGGRGGGPSHCTGSGGGIVKITVTDFIKIDGVISTKGLDGGGENCGGGAGGSIHIETELFEGRGFIFANGGRGGIGSSGGRGGGGGGGRIVVAYQQNTFMGTTLAHGGLGGGVEVLITGLTSSVSSALSSSYNNPVLNPANNASWRPTKSVRGEYFELRPPTSSKYYVTAIETRGGASDANTVLNYTLQYYDDNTEQWKTMLDSDYKEYIPGNPTATGLVKRLFAFPVLTSKVRVWPYDWWQGIAMTARLYGYQAQTKAEFLTQQSSPSVNGGAGGPGTVFWDQRGAVGVGQLDLDNRGQQAGLSFTENDLNLVDTGAAGWILDASQSLDKIVVANGAYLVVDSDIAVSDVLSDNTSLVYIRESRTMKVGSQFEANKYVSDTATLELARDSDITLRMWSYVMGQIAVQGLVEMTVAGNFSFRSQDMHLLALTIEENSVMTVLGSTTFLLNVTSLVVNGIFSAYSVHFTNLHTLSTGPRSNVTFDPLYSDTFFGETVDIRGHFHTRKPVSFTDCQRLMIDGGRLTWDGVESTIISCTNVTINGFFQPTGDVIFGTDIRDIIIGPSGIFRFTAGGPIFTHTLAISGRMELRNKATFQSPIESRKRIITLTIHSPNGMLLLDRERRPRIENRSEISGIIDSELFVDILTVNGLFDAGNLSLPAYLTRVTVGNGGNFTFDPTSDLVADYVTVHGLFRALAPLNILGASVIRTRELLVGDNGTMTLDARSQGAGGYSNVSYLVLETAIVNGVMDPGKIINHRPPLLYGWNFVSVGPKGRLTFYPNDTFYIGYAEIAGVMETLIPVKFLPPPSYNTSNNHFVVDSNGQVKLGVRQAADFANYMQCERLEIKPGGLLNAGYQKQTPTASSVSPLSQFTLTTLVVGGILQGDSLKVLASDVVIDGSITAAGGGFSSNSGPGAGVVSVTSSSGASGASHGGRGGRGGSTAPFTVASNLPYGSIFDADTWGSGGGSTSTSLKNGGRGGGFIFLDISDKFVLNGIVSTNGLPAVAANAGGGSGGSLKVRCRTFTGNGSISSNGGNGLGKGGGGAGGRVLVYFSSGDFKSGRISAYGGTGAEPGGPGLTYLHGDNIRNLRVDNNCQKPAVTEPVGAWANDTAYQSYIYTAGFFLCYSSLPSYFLSRTPTRASS